MTSAILGAIVGIFFTIALETSRADQARFPIRVESQELASRMSASVEHEVHSLQANEAAGVSGIDEIDFDGTHFTIVISNASEPFALKSSQAVWTAARKTTVDRAVSEGRLILEYRKDCLSSATCAYSDSPASSLLLVHLLEADSYIPETLPSDVDFTETRGGINSTILLSAGTALGALVGGGLGWAWQRRFVGGSGK